MIIKILGTGCPNCKLLEENAKKALEELGVSADIENVTDINKIIDYGVMSTPAIVVDDKIKASGKVSSVEEIKDWLK